VRGMAPRHVAVVIPFFQRTPGLLARTLRGVFEQRDAPPIKVIIVDDASPIPAEAELDGIEVQFRENITIVRQPNMGCAGARNTGLSSVPASAEWIAMVDSDDVWTPDHLGRAVTALERDGDFYFADGGMDGTEMTQYRRTEFTADGHRPIPERDDLFVFEGDLMSLLIDRTPFAASTVVYRATVFGSLRFNLDVGICEDLAFWTTVGSRSPRVVFSTRVEVMGATGGVHISHIKDWKTNRSLSLNRDFLHCYNFMLSTMNLSETQRAKIRQKAADARRNAVVTALAMVKARRSVDRGLAFELMRESPAFAADLVRSLARQVRNLRP
jgi:succinoglycan biosynthesis protein ExoW